MVFNSPSSLTPWSHCRKSRYATGEAADLVTPDTFTSTFISVKIVRIISQAPQAGQACTVGADSCVKLRASQMRIYFRKPIVVGMMLLAGPASLFLFSQLRGNLSPIRAVQDPYPV